MKEEQSEQSLPAPPDDWYTGVGIRPSDKNFRPRRPFLILVDAKGFPFLTLERGRAAANYGQWSHLGGGMDFLSPTPERQAQIESHAVKVLRYSGFKPEQISDYKLVLRDRYRYADTFPFPVEWVAKREALSSPPNSWFIGFRTEAKDEILVRPRTGWMRRSYTQEFIAAWYRTKKLYEHSQRNSLHPSAETSLKLQEDLDLAVAEITGLNMQRIEYQRTNLEILLHLNVPPTDFLVKDGLSGQEIAQEDIFGLKVSSNTQKQ